MSLKKLPTLNIAVAALAATVFAAPAIADTSAKFKSAGSIEAVQADPEERMGTKVKGNAATADLDLELEGETETAVTADPEEPNYGAINDDDVNLAKKPILGDEEEQMGTDVTGSVADLDVDLDVEGDESLNVAADPEEPAAVRGEINDTADVAPKRKPILGDEEEQMGTTVTGDADVDVDIEGETKTKVTADPEEMHNSANVDG